MGCDIHVHVERQDEAGEWQRLDVPEPFGDRNYSAFGFLAGVRNYSAVPSIAEPRGIPEDVSTSVAASFEDWGVDAHTPSWLTARELAEFDYEQSMNDRRITRNGNGGFTGTPDEGTVMTYREFLGAGFIDDVETLGALGEGDRVRVVFWFDN